MACMHYKDNKQNMECPTTVNASLQAILLSKDKCRQHKINIIMNLYIWLIFVCEGYIYTTNKKGF